MDDEAIGEERETEFDDPYPANAPVKRRRPHRAETDWDKTPLDDEE
jgi:hypothetical protein